MADWRDLPEGVVALFAKRLQLIEDFIAFRATCSSWRKATSLTDFDKSCPRLPLVLLHKYAYDIDRKWPDYIYRSPRRDRVDCHDKNIQIRDDCDGKDDEMVADEADEIDESDEGTKDSSESEEENFENNVNQVESHKDYEIKEDNSDTGESREMHKNSDSKSGGDSESDENCEVEEDNSAMDESTQMVENSDSDSDSDSEEKCENDKTEEDNSDANESSEMDDKNAVVNLKHMLSTKMDDKNAEVNHDCMFFSLSKGKGCMISLPEANGMECIGSKGWLIMVNRSTGDMCLFHPFTRARITLPHAPPEVTFPMYPKHIRCAVLSASPSETSDYVVMVAYVHGNYISGSCVVYWKPGNLETRLGQE